MITFFVVAALMVLVAFVLIVPPLLGRGKFSGAVRNDLNVSIFKERLMELERDLENEILSQEQFDQTKAELERGLLQDVDDSETRFNAVEVRHGPWGAIITVVLVPLIAAGLYLKLGSTDLLDRVAQAPVSPQQQVEQQHQVADMIASLEERLKTSPDDSQGWYMLARTYTALERYAEAIPAFERAHQLTGDDADVLVNYAEALAMVDSGNFTGRSQEMVKRALEINPQHDKGLWMAGFAAFQEQAYEQALGHWQKLAPKFPPESREGQMLAEYMGQAQAKLGEVVTAVQTTPKPKPAPTQIAIQVTVSLANELAGKASADDIVFIFARAVQGPRMPLAIVKKRVSDLPVEVKLDDSMAMIPDMKISSFKDLVIGARISKSGNAQPQSGDLQGAVRSSNDNQNAIALVIDQEVL